MARKARKKSASKTKNKARKKSAAVTKKPRKAAKNKSKPVARNKVAGTVKPKGVVATIVADIKAVVDTLTDAERLHRKLEPRGSPESES